MYELKDIKDKLDRMTYKIIHIQEELANMKLSIFGKTHVLEKIINDMEDTMDGQNN
jgi:hypothetical protein